MKKVYLVAEATIIWGAFLTRKDAIAFRRLEFMPADPVSVVVLPIYATINDAPTTSADGKLEGVAYL
jgi:hypothetical protein